MGAIRILLPAAGALCLLCALMPLFFGVVNAGVIGLGVIGAAFVLMRVYWDKIEAVIPLKRLVWACLALGFAFCMTVSVLMVRSAYFNAPPESGRIAVIVLGGGIRDDSPMLMLRRRLNAAYRYLVKNPEAVCVMTGGQGPDEIMPESVVMKNYMLSLGIPEERVIIEEKSTNTRENLLYAAEILPETDMPVVVVTDGFHQYRAGLYAKRAGMTTVYSLSSSTPWGLFPAYWVREMFACLSYAAHSLSF